MRLFIFSFIVLVFSSSSFSQSIGASTILFDTGDPSFGYGFGFEYNHNLINNLDLTVQPSFLYNSFNSTGNGKFEYFQIPLLIGVKYYIFNTAVRPYLSAEVIASYFSHDQLVEIYFDRFLSESYSSDNNDSQIKKKENGFYLGGSTSVGTLINIAEQWDLNLNIRLGIVSNRYADFFSYNLGFSHSL